MPKKSETQLLMEFNSIHKNKYSYVFTNYINNKSKIEIICPIHGTYQMSILQHIKGYGCKLCAGCIIKSKEEILNECKVAHNNKYNYDKSNWIKLEDKVIITCSEHGDFTQCLKSHRKGHGCPKCANRYNRTEEEFIEYCKQIEPEVNTTITKFKNVNTVVNFICKRHGMISCRPMQIRKRKYICHICREEETNKKEFIEKSISIHGDKFDYSLVDYINGSTKVKIINKLSGFIFEQTPIKHFKHDYFYNKTTLDDFIINSNITHSNKYNYSNSIYIGNKNKVDIICPEHGKFEQIPNNHIRGSGCPKCNRFNIKESALFNFIKLHTDNIITSDRKILNGKEIDILLPDLNIGFEFNGLYWHSELYRDKNYHLAKSKLCENKGIQLIHI